MKHLIKIETTEHGALSVNHMGKDQQWCEAGLSVKVNNQPDAGWGLQKLYYVVAGSSERHPIDIATRTFIMPNGNVTIGGVFKRFVIGDWTEGKQPNVGHLLAVGQNGEPVPTQVMVADITPKAVNVTHAELEELVRTHALTAGTWYRITDYVATTTQTGTVANSFNRFDIIVRADSEDILNENAFAAHHQGDNYFSSSKLSAWQLKYSLSNDQSRFLWASENGKGVIYWMRDEWGNEAPFDFKGIMFIKERQWFDTHIAWTENVLGENPDDDLLFYTFSWVYGDEDEPFKVQDLSIVGNFMKSDFYYGCCNNKIGDFPTAFSQVLSEQNAYSIPDNIFVNSESAGEFSGCYNNVLQAGCSGNMFGNYCSNNILGFGCYTNMFENGCMENVLGSSCIDNVFHFDSNNTHLGTSCPRNEFSESGKITLSDYCSDNHLHRCNYVMMNHCVAVTLEPSEDSTVSNVHVFNVFGGSEGIRVQIAGDSVLRFVGRDSNGDLQMINIFD